MSYIDHFDPTILLGDRLGLTLYCMFVEAYLAGDCTIEASLYRKFIRHFPGEAGIHTPEIFARLIDSIRLEGFDPYRPVYANPAEYSLTEGAHRCAVAIQLGITSVPYNLRFTDDRTDEAVFHQIFSPDELSLIRHRRDTYIEQCDPVIALRCRIRLIMRLNPASFNAPFSSKTRTPCLRTYQSLESLGINGKRPSELRFDIYGLQKYLNPGMAALEIGCNVGFFAFTVARHIQTVNAFDINPDYIKVGQLVQEFSGTDNCRFSAHSLLEIPKGEQFDVVVSTAVHGWSGLSFPDFVALLDSCTKVGGVILFESHEIDAEKDWLEKKSFLLQKFTLLDSGLIDDVDKSMYASEMREYLLLKKERTDA